MAEVQGILSAGIMLIEERSGSFTAEYGDAGKVLNVTGPATVTVPATLPNGWGVLIMNADGVDDVIVSPGAGMTLTDPNTRATLEENGACAAVLKRSATEIVLS